MTRASYSSREQNRARSVAARGGTTRLPFRADPRNRPCSTGPIFRRWLHVSRRGQTGARDRLERGDLAGSWDDITGAFPHGQAFHRGFGRRPRPHAVLVNFERDALALAIEWAVAPGQTPERLHAALEAYRNLPKLPTGRAMSYVPRRTSSRIR